MRKVDETFVRTRQIRLCVVGMRPKNVINELVRWNAEGTLETSVRYFQTAIDRQSTESSDSTHCVG